MNDTFFAKHCLNVYSLYPFQYIFQLINYCQTRYNNEKPYTFAYLMGMWYGEKKNHNVQWGKCSLFNKLCWETRQPHVEKTKITKINPKCIKD